MCTLFHAFLKKIFLTCDQNRPRVNLNSKEYFSWVKKKEKVKYINYLAKFMSEFSDLTKTYNEGTPKI